MQGDSAWQHGFGLYFQRGQAWQSACLSQSLQQGTEGYLRGNESGQRLQHTMQKQVPPHRNRYRTVGREKTACIRAYENSPSVCQANGT